ncbi:DUF932 domain-containing protein, partial [Klebsiella pneumoniae]|uniref:DUF932 domain-containing protein n=1 Tax=Klebsiella pneumoniae TaxID=573 RepID=UPI001F1BA2F3
SRSDRYTYIPTITLLDKLREEGFQPFFACQSRVRDEDKRGHTMQASKRPRARQQDVTSMRRRSITTTRLSKQANELLLKIR